MRGTCFSSVLSLFLIVDFPKSVCTFASWYVLIKKKDSFFSHQTVPFSGDQWGSPRFEDVSLSDVLVNQMP